jgi:hypothetical protein
MEKTEFVIIGDTAKYKDCLVGLAGTDRACAEEVLDRMVNNPTENDKAISKGHYNLRIKEVASKDCWWHQGWLD